VVGHADEERVARIASPLLGVRLRPGDSLLMDTKAGYVTERIPKSEVEELVLEEVPDIDYADIGGLREQIESIRDAVELPFLHQTFVEHRLLPPKGILLYGPPGCGKTLIAKAVARTRSPRRLPSGMAGPRALLLPQHQGAGAAQQYVGETERHIRLVFQRARDKASEGMPVIVFFDNETRCSALAAPASPATWRTPSSPSC
jgi:proteasome-associated ATPase